MLVFSEAYSLLYIYGQNLRFPTNSLLIRVNVRVRIA